MTLRPANETFTCDGRSSLLVFLSKRNKGVRSGRLTVVEI